MEIPKSFINVIKSTPKKPYDFKSGKKYDIRTISNNGITAMFVLGLLKSSMPNMEKYFPYEIASDPDISPSKISYNKNFDKMKEIFYKYFSQSIVKTFQMQALDIIISKGFIDKSELIIESRSRKYDRYRELVDIHYWQYVPAQNTTSVIIYIIDSKSDHSEFIKDKLKSIDYAVDFVVINLHDTISFPRPEIESFSLEALKKFIDNAREYFIFDVKEKEIPIPITETGDNRDIIDTNVKNTTQILSPKGITMWGQDIINRSKDIVDHLKHIIHYSGLIYRQTLTPESNIIKTIDGVFIDLQNRADATSDKILRLGKVSSFNRPYDLQYFIDMREFFSKIESIIVAGEI